MSFDWKKVLESWRALWSKLSTGRRVGVVSLAVVGAVLLLVLVTWANRDVYVPLYRGGSARAFSDIVQFLDENRVPYEISASTHLDVPEQHVARMRGLLVKEGILEDTGGGGGFSEPLEDLGGLLPTESDKARRELAKQKQRVKAALLQLDFIQDATLTVRREEKSYLQRDHQEAIATVIIRPKMDRQISPQQALIIRHLIASEIPGLDPADVTVSNHYGFPISVGGTAASAVLDDFQMQTQARIDSVLTARAFEAVSVFPRGSVQVTVHADLDFNILQQKQQEIADPESKRTLTENIDSQNSTDPSPGGGSPGPDSEFGGGEGAAGQSTTEKIETTYDYDRTVEKWTNLARYGTKRLSVSLLLHDSLATQKEQIQNLVRGAVGFDEDRNDSMSVEAVTYSLPEAPEEEPLFDILELVGWGAEALSVVAVVVLLMVLMLRAVQKQKRDEAERKRLEEEERLAAEASANLEKEGVDIESADPMRMLNQMEKAAREDPASIARLVKHWISEI